MELDWIWMGAAISLASYVFVFIFLRRFNGFYYSLKLGNKRYTSLPPGDLGWPLLGNFLSFWRAFRSCDPDSFVNSLASKYGKTGIYKTHLFGNPSIIVCDPDICRPVVTDEVKFKYGYSKSIIKLLSNRPMYEFSLQEYKRFRRLITAPIIGNGLSMYIQHTENFVISYLEELASMKHPVDILKEMNKFTFTVIGHVFLGKENEFIVNKIEHFFDDLFEGMLALPVNMPGFVYHKALKARKRLVSFLQPVVEERRRMIMNSTAPLQGKCMMDTFLQLEHENQTGTKLENEDIIDLLISFLFGGRGSTASGIMWSLIYLTEHPQILKKAKEEQEEIMKTRPPSQKQLNIKEIKQMRYLDKVIDEMLRRTSVVFTTFREAKDDVEINGYLIPKGWKVLVWARAIHMDPEYYKNPLEFNPSRWEDKNAKVGTFVPFGRGIRHCPGSDLAKLEISIFLHHFLLNYKFERVNPGCSISYLPEPKPTDNCLARIIKVS